MNSHKPSGVMSNLENKIAITGGKPLNGILEISGAKNSALPIMVGALLTKDDVVLENVPHLFDVEKMANILRELGVSVDFENNIMKIKNGNINVNGLSNSSLTREIRYSIHLLGALLHHTDKVTISLPGGCSIGTRRIDSHIFGLETLGASITVGENMIEAHSDQFVGAEMEFEYPSVGATENIMIAACLAENDTTIRNVAKEPEIIDLANFLNKMGADIKGAGTSILKINGVSELSGITHRLIPDRIETGTYLTAAAITNGTVQLTNTNPLLMEAVISNMKEIGVNLSVKENSITVYPSEEYNGTDIITEVYPGYPTDMQPIICSLLAVSSGDSIVTEKIFDNRFNHVPELNKMGANIQTKGEDMFISGVNNLQGANVDSMDIRSGGGLIVAGLRAKGVTTISGIGQILRGYEDPIRKLQGIGANITLI